MRTILLTGANCPGMLGTVRLIKESSFSDSRIIGIDASSITLAEQICEKAYLVPMADDPQYIKAIRHVCRREKVDVIIPQTTRETAVLSTIRNNLPVMVSSPFTVVQANNKFMLQLVGKKVIPHAIPKTFLIQGVGEFESAIRRLGYPFVIKPSGSFGSRGVRIVTNQELTASDVIEEKPSGMYIHISQLRPLLDDIFRKTPLMVMEYLPGPEYSVDCVQWNDSYIVIPRKRVAIRDGITFHAKLISHPIISSMAVRLAQALHLEYVFGFQFKEDRNGIPKLLECNPRVQGTMVASLLSGINILDLALRSFWKQGLSYNPSGGLNGDFIRYWGGYGISDGTKFTV